MTVAMHLCRGNFQSTYAAEGAYDPAADAVFNKTGVDIFFMEYDTERAGGLEPLGLLAKGDQRVLPGFITTKTPELESVDDLKRKFDEASQYADHRPARHRAAMRLRLDRARQQDRLRRPAPEARPRGDAGRRNLGRGVGRPRRRKDSP